VTLSENLTVRNEYTQQGLTVMQARSEVIGGEAVRKLLAGSELHQQPSLAPLPLYSRAMKRLPRAQSPGAGGFAPGRPHGKRR